MPRTSRVAAVAAVTGAVALLAAFATPRRQNPPAVAAADAEGRAVYDRWCAGCHGDDGKGAGDGAQHLIPKPRDFTRALYQIRTTATGEVPTDADIRHVVDEGMPGTSMPAWKNTLSSGEREAVTRYVKSFSTAFRTAPTPLTFGSDPGGGQAAIDSGRALYRKIECWKCHGDAGRGNGQSAPTLKDDFNNPIRAANLTQNWMFNGGPNTEDIYRRLRSGLDGTPMPGFGDLIDAKIVTDADLWRIAAYVRSLSPEEEPRVRDVVNAARVEDSLPAGPNDSAWAGVERFYFPLVGQVILKPREFSPTVNGVWVQALHNGNELALRVTWHDPSQSPDSSWRLWRGRMARALASDEASADTSSPLADRLAVQFPTQLTEGASRPYFLMGTAEQPVYIWRWESEAGAATEALARGPTQVEPLPPQDDSVRAEGVYDNGEWRVQFVRRLHTGDSTTRLQLVPGRPIPMAFFAWDGSNGETATRMAIGSWVAIYLGEPARAGTFAWPLLAILTTGGLGLVAVRRAQRTASSHSTSDTDPGAA